ncbi:MAG: type II toxin-antitoxin system RelE/ParE family toxin [Treponema sp.]|nr:type II toxin-antitoxin system RelE/ParE family toxin [Treponema sp.]
MKEYLAYKGEKFTIEWYFNQKGESQPLEFFNNLSTGEQQKFFHLLKRMGDFGFISDKTKFRNEDDGIYAFKPQPNRFLSFFFEGNKIIITNAFVKKNQKLKKQDKDCAVNAKMDYTKRIKEASYYEEDYEYI